MTLAANAPVIPTPERRRLRTFAFDPMSTRLTGRYLVVDVPFEAGLQPGPCGSLVQVIDFDATREQWYQPVDLNDIAILAQDGLRPMESDPRTHQQIVYAVAMSVIERFERFLTANNVPADVAEQCWQSTIAKMLGVTPRTTATQ